ncbi:Predicted gene 1141 [Apodemus speciosus]|uniref:Predicted gene 1141 n=1 Tax=Apodemus speciosus TaxID=105296 RepID=A0ABQ0FUD9_APOSI
MERHTHKKGKRHASKSRHRPTHEDLRNLLKKLQKMMDKLGYGPLKERLKAQPTRQQAATASASCQKEMLSVRTRYEQNEVPVFNTYEEYHKMVVQSFENISIVLNIEGKVVFVSQNVSPLLGHRPEDIMGNSLLNLIFDEQKDEVSQKIILNLPLATLVGSLIEFCCYIRKGNVGQSGQGKHHHKSAHKGKDTYEYVKFILYLQDSYDESFVFFGNYGPSSRNIWSSAPRLLWEQQYYLVGNISVLRTPDESAQPVKIPTNVIVVDSDDDNTIQHRRSSKRRRKSKMQRHAKVKVVEEHPEPGADVEYVHVQPTTQQIPSELPQVRKSPRLNISTDINAATSVSVSAKTSTSSSSTDISSTTPISTPTSGRGVVIDPKYMLEPNDMEFEVGPEFILNDIQDEQATPEQGECTEEDVKKPLEETKVSDPKEHAVDEDSAHRDTSSDDDCCIILEDTQNKKDPKIQEVVIAQKQGHQKTPEAVPSCPTTPFRSVRPEAVVEPIVRRDVPVHGAESRRPYQSQRPLLGERFAQLCGPQVRTRVYDLSISRSFQDETLSHTDIEEEEREREQCEYELAQRIEMLRNLPYEQLRQPQNGQGQGPRVYRPRDQVVTVIDDVGPHAVNLFGNDNSEHSGNETHRRREDPVDHAPSLLYHSSRSCQEMTASHQTSSASQHPSAASRQTLATSCQVSAPSCQASALSRQPSAPSCQVSTVICTIMSGIHSITSSICTIMSSICSVTPSICTIMPSISTITPSICTIMPSISTITPSICTIMPSIGSITPSICTIMSSIHSITPSICTIMSSIHSITSSTCTIMSSISSTMSSICTIMSSICSVMSSICTIMSSICSVTSSICTIMSSISSTMSSICTIMSSIRSITSSTCTIMSSIRSITSSTCTIMSSIRSVTSSICTIMSSIHSITSSTCTIMSSIRSITSSTCTIMSSIRSITSSTCTIMSSIRSITSSTCTIMSSIRSITSSTCTIMSSIRSITSSTCTIMSSIRSVTSSICTIMSSICSITSSICTIMSSIIVTTSISSITSAISNVTLNASSDHRRENRPHFLPPGQDHIGYVRAEEDTNPRP